MADEFEVRPAELRDRVAGDVAGAGSQVRAVVSGLEAQLGGEGAAWGEDALGSRFADGAGGYLAQAHWVEGSVGAMAGWLDGLADKLRQAADAFEGSDQDQRPSS